MVTLAPLERRYWIVGRDARILVSSVIAPSLIGTLRSQRTKTFFDFKASSVRSVIDFFAADISVGE